MKNQKSLFFSIVIPAHNEETTISETLKNIKELSYPSDKYEVIVVENGSTDRTLEIAKEYEGENINVFSLNASGVSMAKNFGAEKTSPNADWVVFLDADTVIKKSFLDELNNYLTKKSHHHCVIGSASVKPLSGGFVANFWFFIYNLGHFITRTSFSIQIVKKSILTHSRFDERLSMGEDLKFITDSMKYGKFFYFITNEAFTSIRRFRKEGWLKLFLHWSLVAVLPNRAKQKITYKVIR